MQYYQTEYTKFGDPIGSFSYCHGTLHGPYELYGYDHTRKKEYIREIGTYRNNLFHGKKITYSNRGYIESKEKYKNGKLNGLQRIYKNNVIISETFFNYDRKHGVATHYLYNGMLKSNETYHFGVLLSSCYYDKLGVVRLKIYYFEKNLKKENYYKDGKIKIICILNTDDPFDVSIKVEKMICHCKNGYSNVIDSVLYYKNKKIFFY